MAPKMPNRAVFEAVTGRRSVRAFLPDPIPSTVVSDILSGASRAPSGQNMQPWLVHVVTGRALEKLSAAAVAAAEAEETSLEYQYLPVKIREPYLSRRRKIGFDLYAKYGIGRDDIAERKAAMMRNFTFFGAPVGLFFTIERDMAMGAWMDCAMFMQNVMVLARAYGLETCPQQAWCDFGAVVHRELGLGSDVIVLSGMSLGREDKAAVVNTLASERIGLGEFVTWHE